MAGLCPVHGPYDGTACPYPPPHQPAASTRPARPAPLNDDEIETDLGGYDEETAPTMAPGSRDGMSQTKAPTAATKRRILDLDDDGKTEFSRPSGDDVTELDSPVMMPLGIFWVKEGARRGRYYPIRHGTMIGRKEGDLFLDDPKVSATHAKLTMEGDQFILWDLASSNGTYVNGKKIRGATLLSENDLVKIGDTVFVVKLLEARPRRRAAAASERTAEKKPAAKKKRATG